MESVSIDGKFSLDNWVMQLHKGLLELWIVNLIGDRELYGYDLVKRICDTEGLSVAEGSIYPLLARMQRAGLLQSRLEESPRGPARKYYALTAKGREAREHMNVYWRRMKNRLDGVAEKRGES